MATSGIFSLPLELHAHISHFATPTSLIALSKTCYNAYRIYKPLHLHRLVQLTRISIINDGLSCVESQDLEGSELDRAVKGAFHERVIRTLSYAAPVVIVKRFFDILGWDVKRDRIHHYSHHLNAISIAEIYNPAPLPPYLALLPLQVLFRVIATIKEPTWISHEPFIREFDRLCFPMPGAPHYPNSPKANYGLPHRSYLKTLDLTPTSPYRNLALLIILAKNIGQNLNTFAMPYYVPWFHLHYPQIATYLMFRGLSPHAPYPAPPAGPPAKLLRYTIRLNVRMLRLLLQNGVDPNIASPITSCNLQRAVSGLGPHAQPLVHMRPIDLLFSGHVIPSLGNVEEHRHMEVLPVGEMVDRAMECFEVLREFGAEVEMERIEEMCILGFRQVWGIYGSDVWVESISGNCAYIAGYFVGMGRRLGLGFVEELEGGEVRRRFRGCCIS